MLSMNVQADSLHWEVAGREAELSFCDHRCLSDTEFMLYEDFKKEEEIGSMRREDEERACHDTVFLMEND